MLSFIKKLSISGVVLLLLIVLSIWGALRYLKSYTQHGITYSVPDVNNLPINEAIEVLQQQGLEYLLLDSVWNRKIAKGLVINQNPLPETQVKEGRRIYLTINARSDKKIKLYIDNVISGSTTRRGALDNLSSYDIRVDSIEVVDYPYDDIVLAVLNWKGRELKSGDWIDAGSRVILRVGHKGKMSIALPDLTGATILEAELKLKQMGLNYSASYLNDGSCEEPLDTNATVVIQQKPDPKKMVKTGEIINLIYNCQ